MLHNLWFLVHVHLNFLLLQGTTYSTSGTMLLLLLWVFQQILLISSNSSDIRIFTTDTPVSKVITFNDTYIVGSQNFIYKLSKDLQVLGRVAIGPINGEDNWVTLLSVKPDEGDEPLLLWCGSVDRGSCHINRLRSNIGLSPDYLDKTYVTDKRTDREARLQSAAITLRERMEQAGMGIVDVSSRPKHLYGIFRKMERQQKDFNEIFDVAAIRLIVNTNEECYRALAIAHDAFRPIPGRFKDYIGLPKPNRYQSLHTVVIGNYGRPIEVQIRTLEMHHIAEYGIAAHWKYKESGGSSNAPITTDEERFTWLRQLLEWQSDLKDAQEFMDNVKGNLFDEDVYVFTPDGDVISLTRGASPIDFAYRIHTEVGNHCAGARVNGRIVPLDTPLENGDIVEIITQKNSHPSLDWLNYVVTAGARNRIRQWYKRSHRDENVARGREMLEKEMGKSGLDAMLKSEPAQAVAERCNYPNAEDLLAGLGYGEVTLNLVVNRLREAVKAQQPMAATTTQEEDAETILAEAISSPARPPKPNSNSPILGVEGLLYHIAGCCNPLPGESIIGAVSMGSRGIAIHRQRCPNVERIPGDRLIPVSWNHGEATAKRSSTYPVQVSIQVIDRVGVLKDILSHLSDLDINVHKAQVKTFPAQTAEIELGLDVRDHSHLEQTFTQLRKMTDVLSIRRISEAS